MTLPAQPGARAAGASPSPAPRKAAQSTRPPAPLSTLPPPPPGNKSTAAWDPGPVLKANPNEVVETMDD